MARDGDFGYAKNPAAGPVNDDPLYDELTSDGNKAYRESEAYKQNVKRLMFLAGITEEEAKKLLG